MTTKRTLDDENEKSPIPKGAVVINLTDDGKGARSKKPGVLRYPRPLIKRFLDDPQGMNDSKEGIYKRTNIELTNVDEMEIDEPLVSRGKRKRESPDESTMLVDQLSNDHIRLYRPGDDVNVSGLRLSVLRAAAGPSSTIPVPGSPKQPNSMVLHPPDKRWTFSPGPERPKSTEKYDTCFGMLLVEAEANLEAILPTECTPAIVSISRMIVTFSLQDQDTCVAVLVAESLCKLLDRFKITLNATVCGKKHRSIKNQKPRAIDELQSRACPVRLHVYGFMGEEMAVGNALGQAGLFLQHPGAHEIDRNVKYHNPQYLLPPGESMPDIKALTPICCCLPTNRGAFSRSSLGELERSQILKIFDSAYEASFTLSIEQSPRLQTKLKRHQLEALVMMVEKEAGIYHNANFPPLWRPSSEHNGRYKHVVTGRFEMEKPPPVGGGILADEMGLGKTLSTLSLICHSLDNFDKLSASSQRKMPRDTLVVTPKSTIHVWENQIQRHIREGRISFIVYHGQNRQQELRKSASYDIVLTTYDTLRFDRDKKGPLLEKEWARVVLDEAHKIRNHSSKTFKAVFQISAQKRWCLTGTPIQNSLDDFGALLLFVGVPPFHEAGMFAKVIGNRVNEKKEGSLDTLRTLIAATTLRRTKASHAAALGLTRKTERMEMVNLTGNDKQLYEFFKRRSYLMANLEKSTAVKGKGRARTGGSGGNRSNIVVLISLLRLICDHGEALLPESATKAWRDRDPDAINWDVLESGVDKCVGCGNEVDSLEASDLGNMTCGHVLCTECAAKSQINNDGCPKCGSVSSSSPLPPALQSLSLTTGSKSPSKSPSKLMSSPLYPSQPFGSAPSIERYVPSDKVKALLRNIDMRSAEKHVIFSYWTKMLDQIAKALKISGLKSQRIDGQTSLQQRREALEKFNDDASYLIMLASIGAAGEGIELTAATTVHIIEPHWNPSAEAQAVDRVHRFGQERDVTVIRYVASDSIEVYVQWIQAEKLRLIKDSFAAAEQTEEKVREIRWNRLLEYLE